VSGRAGTGGGAGGGDEGARAGAAPRAGAAASAVVDRPRRWFADSRCTVIADPPARDRGAERILGPAHYRCDRPGAGVEFTVFLQQRAANGAWTSVDSRPVAASGAATTRDRSEQQRTHWAGAPCADGTYRTFLRGSITIDGRTSAIEDTSWTVTNPCRSARAR
jgi:hypothetical protein